MNFQTILEELDRLYEEDQVKTNAEEAVEEEPKEAAAEEGLEEGIFDSKAKKQKAYEQEVNDVFGAPSVRLANDVANNASRVIEEIANQDERLASTAAKTAIRLLKAAMIDAKGKTFSALIKAVISIGAKNGVNNNELDYLKDFNSKVLKLSDVKPRQYLMAKVNETTEKKMTQLINWLKKEYNITESLEEATDEPVEDVEVAEEAEVVEEATTLVLECANCGAIMIKAEANVVVDEEADLANIDEQCQYCEAAEGHKIIGTLAPYGVEDEVETEEVAFEDSGVVEESEEEVVEEGLLDIDMPVSLDVQANGNEVAVGGLTS